jgi:hypothetical protein
VTRPISVPTGPNSLSLRLWLRGGDEYGISLLLILATIVTLATVGDGGLGQFVGIALGGGTLLFVLRTSGARRGTVRVASVLVALSLVLGALSILSGASGIAALWRLIGLMLAFGAPLAIFRRILTHETITGRTILGALCIYLLIGLTFAYIFSIHETVAPPFFVQVGNPTMADFIYFSYVTLATIGYGDLTAAQPLGRMVAVSDGLIGQLYLVSAVALLVGNVGRRLARPVGAQQGALSTVESIAEEDQVPTAAARAPVEVATAVPGPDERAALER